MTWDPAAEARRTLAEVAQRDLERDAGWSDLYVTGLEHEARRTWIASGATGRIPAVTCNRRHDPWTTGRAWSGPPARLHFSVSLNADHATIAGLVCHEVAHLLTPKINHGPAFWRQFEATVLAAWGCRVEAQGKNKLVRHASIVQQLRAHFHTKLLAINPHLRTTDPWKKSIEREAQEIAAERKAVE